MAKSKDISSKLNWGSSGEPQKQPSKSDTEKSNHEASETKQEEKREEKKEVEAVRGLLPEKLGEDAIRVIVKESLLNAVGNVTIGMVMGYFKVIYCYFL